MKKKPFIIKDNLGYIMSRQFSTYDRGFHLNRFELGINIDNEDIQKMKTCYDLRKKEVLGELGMIFNGMLLRQNSGTY